MNSADLKERSKQFAYACIDVAMSLPDNDLGRHVKRQLIRSSTSVAANYRAACRSQSDAAFIAKLSIPIEECDESQFWLQLAVDKGIIERSKSGPLIDESDELLSIFVASRKRIQSRIKDAAGNG